MFFRSMKVWIAATVLVVLVLAGTAIGVHVTSSTSFCLSCHEMRVHQQELALSPHAQDARGNAIECVQCHIPSTNIVDGRQRDAQPEGNPAGGAALHG